MKFVLFKNIFWLSVFSIFIVCGCATTTSSGPRSSNKDIMDAYLSKIQKYDGINQDEAILLAQSQLIFHGTEKKYYLDKPEVVWENAKHWGIKFYPINKTLAEASIHAPLVIDVDKKDGSVKWEQ